MTPIYQHATKFMCQYITMYFYSHSSLSLASSSQYLVAQTIELCLHWLALNTLLHCEALRYMAIRTKS